MTRLVAQDQDAHLPQRRVAAIAVQQAVIGGRGDLGQHQDHQFGLDPAPAAEHEEDAKAPMARNGRAAEPGQGRAQQAGMLALFREPGIDQGPNAGTPQKP
ncbi:MAG: hypothetical protein AAF908_00980, partial [Pseudomonadota bacterium]